MSVRFTLRQLDYFDAIASEGSLAAAAERCHLSASALALALDDLERHLGVQLVVRRKGRGVTLTPTGTRMLSTARQLLSDAEGLAAEALQAAEGVAGRLAIGVFETLSPSWLPEILEGFRQENPNVEIDFIEGNAGTLHDRLLQGRIEVALLYKVDVSPQLSFDPVHALRLHVIVPEGHPLADRGAIHLREIVNEPLVSFDVAPAQQNTEQIFRSLALDPDFAYRVQNYEVVRSLVGRGLGYSVLFQRPAISHTYDGRRIVQLEVLDDVQPTIVGLARPSGAPQTRRYHALRTFLRGITPGGDQLEIGGEG